MKKPAKPNTEREALERRKAELEYLAQMSALEGLPMPKPELDEYTKIKRQLAQKAAS